MSDEKKIFITKVGGETVKPLRKTVKHSPGHKTKKATKSILKIKGVRDPAKAPPLKRGMRNHTIRVLTDKGIRKHKKTVGRKLSKLSDSKVKEIVTNAGLVKNDKTPPGISRAILNNAVSAGFLSL